MTEKVKAVIATVLWTRHIEASIRFYRALGLPLEEERHGDGPVHYACNVGGAHVALWPAEGGDAPRYRTAGATLVGFSVGSVDEVYAALVAVGAGVERSPERAPWGKRAVLRDPDGRPIEINEEPVA
jgi:catechol 2,3-dioxygenase-like lactoylglutathione lyase family enzyme